MPKKSHSDPPLPLGRDTIGRYDIIYPLASGGMASVYVGRLSGMAGFEKLITLKVIHSHLATKRQFVDMFLDEARLAAKLHHPNIGEVYEIVEDGGRLFIAAEFINGCSLRQLLRACRTKNYPLSPVTAAWICAKVCQGLQVVHTLTDDEGVPLNLVHRDISPSNIMLSFKGWVKLIDFGIAFAQNRLTQTATGNMKGKIGYISPEQINGARLDCRADIFSLGVILYQSMTGRHPFPGKTDVERLKKTVDKEVDPPSILATNIPPELDAIVLKALAKNPTDRYQDAASLERDLRQYLADTHSLTGATDVSLLVETLFAEHKKHHQTELAKFKVRTPIPPSAHPLSNAPISFSATGAPPISQSTSFRESSPKYLLMILAGVLISSGIFAGLFLFSLSSDNDAVKVATQQSLTEYRDTDSAKRYERPVLSPETVSIPVSLLPPNAILLCNGTPQPIHNGAISLPLQSEPYEIEAKASGFVSQTYHIHPQNRETLNINLQPAEPSVLSPPDNACQTKSNRPAKRKKRVRKTKRVLKRNPY